MYIEEGIVVIQPAEGGYIVKWKKGYDTKQAICATWAAAVTRAEQLLKVPEVQQLNDVIASMQ